ncbi:nuclease [Nocardioides agariphilus]|uniref:Nuclease n=1 Tax=Nocardioides agariphilus TaxID=433664 RepID=A0A930VP67_9ACTN|nr:nuclease [Nocardioides agariphilus]MBF4768157.1 nuclease [Nocardioides agariphilus]
MPGGRRTFVVIDGENIDATLGTSILQRRPNPEERPRWDRVTEFAADLWDQPVTGLFFINASQGYLPLPFVQALLALDYRVIPLSGDPGQKVVDVGIQRTLEALAGHDDADVLLLSHDADFADHMARLQVGDRRLGLIAFPEFTSGQFTELGIRIHDLETEVGAFNTTLPRVRIIPLDEFDPESFLR